MNDTTVKKVDSAHSPEGTMGQKYLASGVSVSMRLWEESPGSVDPQPMSRDYEVVGFVIKGTAELELEDQKLLLNPGESWLVPKHAVHRYRILEPFVAIEATAPPAHVHDRDSK
ncbi:cupin domain-containing protein [Gimesia sp.]|uniref:cupin domain-containing protein n=1 Tax=Gimesia sp. TaxID=2024833 RepID=UPI0032F03AFD